MLKENNLSIQLLATINVTLAINGLMLKTSNVVDATLIERDPKMRQTMKGNQWHFGMNAHIDVDAESGLKRVA